MGRRGPAPTPTALRVLKGKEADHHARPKNEPKPRSEVPPCPSWLDVYAKQEWRRMAPILYGLGLLTEVDGAALAGYCQAYANWRAATEALQAAGGPTFETPNGFLQARPEVTIAKHNLTLIKAFCQEFGMTPSARSRMQLPEQKRQPSDMESLLD